MNSSIKFIYNLIYKLKLPLIGYAIVITPLLIGAIISHKNAELAHLFSSLFLFFSSVIPLFILPLAVSLFFSFRSNKAYAIFLSTIPIPKKKQFVFSFVALFVLVTVFSLITFLSAFILNHVTTQQLPIVQLFIMGGIYFLTLSLYTAIITFLKVLLIDNRSFLIALFFFVISIWITVTTPFPLASKALNSHTVFPLPLNMLGTAVAFPILSIARVLIILSGIAFFIAITFYLYQKELKMHQQTRTKTIATIIIYSLILTPTLYVFYQFPPHFLLIVLIVLFILAVAILKISFKKVSLWTLLTPFIIANCISIPLTIVTPTILAQQNKTEWEHTQFVNRKDVTFSLSNLPLFNQKRSIYLNISPSKDRTHLLQELERRATIQTSHNTTSSFPPPTDAKSYLNVDYYTLEIIWKSEEAKQEYAKLIEKSLIELDQNNQFSIIATTYSDKNDPAISCTISDDLKPTCSSTSPPSRLVTSLQKTIIAIDELKAQPDSDYTYSIDATSINNPTSQIFITISN